MTHTNLALVQGEVYILSEYGETIYKEDFMFRNKEVQKCTIIDGNDVGFRGTEGSVYGDRNVYWQNSLCQKVLASTAKLEGIPQLDRKHFVKPFDMKGMQDAYIHENNYYNYDDKERDIIKSALEDGYNFKEAEFTREDMEKAIDLAFTHGRHLNTSQEKITHSIFQVLMPDISLPKSVTLNENNELISVEW